MLCQDEQRAGDRQIVAFDKTHEPQYRYDREVVGAERDVVELAPEHKPGGGRRPGEGADFCHDEPPRLSNPGDNAGPQNGRGSRVALLCDQLKLLHVAVVYASQIPAPHEMPPDRRVAPVPNSGDIGFLLARWPFEAMRPKLDARKDPWPSQKDRGVIVAVVLFGRDPCGITYRHDFLAKRASRDPQSAPDRSS